MNIDGVTEKTGERKWLTLGFLCLAFFFYMSTRQMFGLLVIPIQKETGLTDIQLGFIDTVMFWTLAAVVPFAGMLGDRFSRTHIIAGAIFFWGLFTALTGLAGGLISLIALRSVAITAAQTFYGPSAYALIADKHKETRSVALSCHQGAMYTGMLCSGVMVAELLRWFGSWRGVYALFGGLTMLVGVAFFIVFCLKRGDKIAKPCRVGALADANEHSRPIHSPSARAPTGQLAGAAIASGEKVERKSLMAGMKAFFSNPAAICAGAGFVALNFVANGYGAWAPKFIAGKFGLGVGETAKGVMFYPNVAAMVAVLFAGFLTDAMVKRNRAFRLVLQIGALLVGVPAMVAFGFTDSTIVIWTSLVTWGIARGLFQANSHASVFDVVPKESRSSAIGFLNMMTCLVGSLSPLAIGVLSHRYGVKGFEIGFSALGVVLLVAAAAMAYSKFFLFERYRVKG